MEDWERGAASESGDEDEIEAVTLVAINKNQAHTHGWERALLEAGFERILTGVLNHKSGNYVSLYAYLREQPDAKTRKKNWG